jgi:two-component system, cell cycle sensor histidine kinase and response regulator CckA
MMPAPEHFQLALNRRLRVPISPLRIFSGVEGTTVTEQAMVSASGSELHGAGETLLVVEDDDSLRRLIARILTRGGYDVIETDSPTKALEICNEHGGSIDLLVTDVNMPGMAGNELAREIGLKHPGIRALFMSGAADDSITKHGFFQPGEGFVQKPFTAAELLEKVGRALLY